MASKHNVYLPAKAGPFRCDHCTFERDKAKRCTHPEIIRLQQGKIEPGGCCDYFHGKKRDWLY